MGVTVRERPKGSGEWWIFVNHQGQRKAKKVGNDEAEANKVAEKVKAKIALGEWKPDEIKPKRVPTFKEYAERWLALPHEQKESTIELYRSGLHRFCIPAFGKIPLDKISKRMLKEFFEDLQKKGLNPITIKTIRSPMNHIFEHALDMEIIERNPLQDIRLKGPRKKGLQVNPLTHEEVTVLLEKAKTHKAGFYYPSFLCALRTGMRIGEIEALEWGHIDFNSGFIEVKASHREGRLTDTKNRNRRRVDMSPHLAETLQALRLTQKKRALRTGRPFPEWVFAGKHGKMLNRSGFTRAIQKCLELAGLRRIRVHDLRHSYATIRLMAGHNIGDVSYQLGHASISFTYDVYGHWIPGKFKNEVNELDDLQPSTTYTQPENPTLENLL